MIEIFKIVDRHNPLTWLIAFIISCLIGLIICGLFLNVMFVDGQKKRKKKEILRAAGGKSGSEL